MQDPTGFQQMKAPAFPEQEQLKCPRCDSSNTKFCYYNNYNLSQPRHFCKNCRRYWTKGGALRNIPVGGGTRKATKRSSSSSSSSSSSTATNNNNNPKRHPNPSPDLTPNQKIPEPSPPPTSPSTMFPQQVVLNSGIRNSDSEVDPTRMYLLPVDHRDRKMMDIGGSFSSLLASGGQFGNLLEGLNSNGSGLKTAANYGGDRSSGREPGLGESSDNGESYLGGGETGCWSGDSNGWPDLSIYTPGSSFQR
ncbi:hypothetical protein V6N13_132756 [Hibiscus sabdariffa]|uniref:Dof zinc finger protein n=1 Tax=Hibiscus sabdariffa TaxID=183260 RepID=A0ABR2PWT8_9ROSI